MWLSDYFRKSTGAVKSFLNMSSKDAKGGRCTLNLPDEILLSVLLYLEPSDIRSLSESMRSVSNFQKFSPVYYDYFWKHQYYLKSRSFDRHSTPESVFVSTPYTCFQQLFIENIMIERIMDYQHSLLMLPVYRAITIYNQSFGSRGGILGPLCDLAWTEDPLVSYVLSRKRHMAMTTLIVQNDSVVPAFKKHLNQAYNEMAEQNIIFKRGLVAHLSLENVSKSQAEPEVLANDRVQENLKRFSFLAKSTNNIEGFRGFALHLLRLKPENEYLRYTVFWMLFRELMVFDTIENMQKFQEKVTLARSIGYPAEEIQILDQLQDYTGVLDSPVYAVALNQYAEYFSEQGTVNNNAPASTASYFLYKNEPLSNTIARWREYIGSYNSKTKFSQISASYSISNSGSKPTYSISVQKADSQENCGVLEVPRLTSPLFGVKSGSDCPPRVMRPVYDVRQYIENKKRGFLTCQEALERKREQQ